MTGVTDRAGGVLTKAKRRVGIENPSAADDAGKVGIVRGALRAFGEGDTDRFLEVLHSDVTWEAPGGNFPGGSDLEGREEVRDRFLDHVRRTFTQFGFEPESYLDAGAENAVVVFGRFAGEGVEGGGVDAPGVQVWMFKGSEAELVRIYTDGAAFPEVLTEAKEQRREEERKEKEEQKERSEREGSDEDDGGDGDDG